MSSSERSPKRRRTSYSPVSPPLPDAKAFIEGQSLHTPPPSVHMSPSWQSQGLPPATNMSTTIPTPPSTASFPSQNIARSTEGDNQAYTPVEKPSEGRDREGDVEMEGADHRRTDHSRIADEETTLPPAPPAPVLYCLSTEPVVPLLPDPSLDMLDLYSLKAMQASVARRDPKTGEKINKLRKSYETKSRNLGIEGRNKATVQMGHLQGLVDPGWDSLVPEGMTMWEQKMEGFALGGKGTEEMFESLEKAFQLRPGHFPKAEHAEWTQQLGLDEPTMLQRPQAGGLVSSKSTNSLMTAKTNPSAAGRATAPSSPGALRPDRAGKKRRYDESSYEGYDDDGYSTGGVDDAGRRINGAKRMKRKGTGM